MILNETAFMYQPVCIRKLKREELYQLLSSENLCHLWNGSAGLCKFCAGCGEVGVLFGCFTICEIKQIQLKSAGESNKHRASEFRGTRLVVGLLKMQETWK